MDSNSTDAITRGNWSLISTRRGRPPWILDILTWQLGESQVSTGEDITPKPPTLYIWRDFTASTWIQDQQNLSFMEPRIASNEGIWYHDSNPDCGRVNRGCYGEQTLSCAYNLYAGWCRDGYREYHHQKCRKIPDYCS